MKVLQHGALADAPVEERDQERDGHATDAAKQWRDEHADPRW
jgi:hypothetical protein